MRSSSECGTDGCGPTSATSRASTTPSPPSTRPSGSRGRRSSAFARDDSSGAVERRTLDQRHPDAVGGIDPSSVELVRRALQHVFQVSARSLVTTLTLTLPPPVDWGPATGPPQARRSSLTQALLAPNRIGPHPHPPAHVVAQRRQC